MKKIIQFGIGLLLVTLLACGKESTSNQTLNSPAANTKQYIVVFKAPDGIQASSMSAKAIVSGKVSSMGVRYSIQSKKQFSKVIQAAVFVLSEEQRKKLILDPDVAYIEEDKIISIESVQNSPVWGLDRIDQVGRSLDSKYEHNSGSAQVNAYVIDTGIRISHQEFEGRAVHGIDTVDNDSDSTDCNGHGTHVAGTIGGRKYGVAKDVKLIGVRVLDCGGSGRTSDVIDGVEWVTNNHVKPAVANMSLGGGISTSLDNAVKASIAAGVSYAIAAGNSSRDACSSSPARVDSAITVGASNDRDRITSFSNHGSCVDIIAPGEDIKSAYYSSNTVTRSLDGTSMASPHVAGAIALLLSHAPQASPAEIHDKIIEESLLGTLSGLNSATPNRLLNTMFLLRDGGGDDGGSGEDPVDGPIHLVRGANALVGDISSPEEVHMLIDIPENAIDIKVDISASSGDADLYVKHSSRPSLTDYDCRPYRSGSNESCSYDSLEEGQLHIVIRAYSDVRAAKIKVDYDVKEDEPEADLGSIPAPCSSCDEYLGELSSTGDSNYHPNSSYYYQKRSKTHKVWIRSLGQNDFDIELYKWVSGKWKKVKSSRGSGSDESISYRGSRGYYTIKIVSKYGGGAYKVWHVGK